MTISMSVSDISTDIIYGLLMGWNCTRLTENGREFHKSWTVHLYYTERGRKQGIQYNKRVYGTCDFVTFDLQVSELFGNGNSIVVIPKERYVEADVLAFIKEKKGEVQG